MAGVDAIFYGDTRLVAANPEVEADLQWIADLGLKVLDAPNQGSAE